MLFYQILKRSASSFKMCRLLRGIGGYHCVGELWNGLINVIDFYSKFCCLELTKKVNVIQQRIRCRITLWGNKNLIWVYCATLAISYKWYNSPFEVEFS